MIKKIWIWLNGNKTIICLAIVTLLEKAAELNLIEKTNVVEFVSWLFLALATGAFAHHVQKAVIK